MKITMAMLFLAGVASGCSNAGSDDADKNGSLRELSFSIAPTVPTSIAATWDVVPTFGEFAFEYDFDARDASGVTVAEVSLIQWNDTANLSVGVWPVSGFTLNAEGDDVWYFPDVYDLGENGELVPSTEPLDEAAARSVLESLQLDLTSGVLSGATCGRDSTLQAGLFCVSAVLAILYGHNVTAFDCRDGIAIARAGIDECVGTLSGPDITP